MPGKRVLKPSAMPGPGHGAPAYPHADAKLPTSRSNWLRFHQRAAECALVCPFPPQPHVLLITLPRTSTDEQGFVVIPKSVSPKRIASNAAIFDFELAPEDMAEVR